MNVSTDDIRAVIDSVQEDIHMRAGQPVKRGSGTSRRTLRRSVANTTDKSLTIEFLGTKSDQVNEISVIMTTDGDATVTAKNLMIVDLLLQAAYNGWQPGWLAQMNAELKSDGQSKQKGRVKCELMFLQKFRYFMIKAK